MITDLNKNIRIRVGKKSKELACLRDFDGGRSGDKDIAEELGNKGQ